MKIIAFYLPQYHPIQENNEWWGNGFTEWTNVSKARPLYTGHYQPQIPADLGFYDLRLSEVREEQAEMAKAYGIDAFCYYHYWFNGKMLLERPFNEVIRSGKPHQEFCLCWANENWTRRWDGMNQQVLIEQNYADYDPAEHIKWLSEAFQDQRYIKVNNKPLFLVYRASDIPNLREVISAWRIEVKKYGVEDMYVCCANNSQNILSIQEIEAAGFDAIYDFTPNLKDFREELSVSTIPGLNILSYKKIVERDMEKKNDGNITAFPCVFPSWDNSPRRNNNATIIQNEDANLYAKWLGYSIDRVKQYKDEEQIVFINAWNEWGEGCHLEPDLKHGHMFLEATKHAIQGKRGDFQFQEQYKTNQRSMHSNNVSFEKGRDIYIWGTGGAGQQALEVFKQFNIEVAGFIDNNMDRVNSRIDGHCVFSKSELTSYKNTNSIKPFVCVASMFHEEIEKDLEELNYSRNFDYTINVLSSSVKIKTLMGKDIIIFENGCYCNLCGFNKFTLNNLCEKCGSSSEERVIVEILAEELGTAGIPLSEWIDYKHLNILNVNAIKNNPFLDLKFSCSHLDFNKGSACTIEEVYDYCIINNDFQLDNKNKLFLKKIISHSSKSIILAQNKEIFNQLLKENDENATYTICRDYERYKTGYCHLVIFDRTNVTI
jgi:hypothetical protein